MTRVCRSIGLSVARAIGIVVLAGLCALGQKPGVGKLLVASPRVTNAQFRHTVILLIGSDAKGAAGLVLNRTGDKTLAELFPDVASAQGRTDTAFRGGPVGQKLMFCLVAVRGRLREARQVLPGLYFSNDKNLMDLALNARETATTFRVYVGYAGWTAEQLKRELNAGDWKVETATVAMVFDPAPATLWERLEQLTGAGPGEAAPRHPLDARPGWGPREPQPGLRVAPTNPTPGAGR